MILERQAPAKVNLGLHVLQKRPDGYHDIETVFLRLPWFDSIMVQPADDLILTCSDPGLPVDEENLCVQAARQLMQAAGVKLGAAIHLEKRIPYGAGLGGGSSDAASTLMALNTFWNTGLSIESLMEIGAGLGSDVPFFLSTSAAFGEGRGEVLTPLLGISGMPYRFPFAMLVVVPSVHVSTADAYRHVSPKSQGRADLRAIVSSNTLSLWREKLVNDFEPSVFQHFPEVKSLKEQMIKLGASYATMSGSGSAVLGVFEEDEEAARAASFFKKKKDNRVWVGNKFEFEVV